jgi:CheY-like chemotaxis protein
MKVQEKFEDPSILVLFSVQDTGIGIKEEDKPKIFRLFGKLDQDDPQINRNGIGLGLSISNNLAKMLYNQNGYGSEGGIQVESEFGKGSTFFFMISGGSLEPENFSGTSEHKAIRTFTRLCQIEEGQNYKGLGQVIPEFPSEKKIISRLDIRVLIVEDDLINISVLELYLKFFGIAYLVAINGLNAVKIVEEEVIQKNNEISLILMDCNMPIMDGFKASEKIQEMLVRNKREDIPIVAATANTGKEDIEMCRNSGMKYYMEKPIQKKELGLFLQKMFKVSLNI